MGKDLVEIHILFKDLMLCEYEYFIEQQVLKLAVVDKESQYGEKVIKHGRYATKYMLEEDVDEDIGSLEMITMVSLQEDEEKLALIVHTGEVMNVMGGAPKENTKMNDVLNFEIVEEAYYYLHDVVIKVEVGKLRRIRVLQVWK